MNPVCVAVGWSSVPSFSPLLGEMVIEDVTQLQYDITELTTVCIERTTCYTQTHGVLKFVSTRMCVRSRAPVIMFRYQRTT